MTEPQRILVVDDDVVSQRLVSAALTRKGFEAVTADNVLEAKSRLRELSVESFQCAVVDYRMPTHTGLDLVSWLQEEDSTLASIILTAESDKNLIARIFHEGGTGYLEKPVDLKDLHESVLKAVDTTAKNRRLRDTELAANQIGQTQYHLLGIKELASRPEIKVCYAPMHQAGGDFINVFPTTDRQYLVISADVSGHDLKAAYISTFAQGVVRGMIEQSASVEEVYRFLNHFLVNEWNARNSGADEIESSQTSLSVCAATIDPVGKLLKLYNAGAPSPVYIDRNGMAKVVDVGCPPLGWFEDGEVAQLVFSINSGGYLYLWSDGLDDLAEIEGVTNTTMVYRLLHSDEDEKNKLLRTAIDDVLIIRLDLFLGSQLSESWQPLIISSYPGNMTGEIDSIVEEWEHNLRYALPNAPELRLLDVSLCGREALLNAMQHGCEGDAGLAADVQIHYHPEDNCIRMRVEDPGEGYPDNYLTSDDDDPDDCLRRNCGLMLIKNGPDKLKVERDGAVLTMDFSLNEVDES